MAMAEAVDVPKIVVVPHERSIHFNKRECTLVEPQKVGRSVDKKRILQNNLIFDCRVLSRNHALIWFENGKFFIKDTKSSNGTFVNETRLSSSGEESTPRELRSKDLVQFGVNVNVDKKAHGCIIARVHLFVNDVELPGVEPPVQQVLQIIQNALSREQELEAKLMSMQTAIEGARQIANESMIAIVKEDELLSRLEMLENQLQIYAKNSSEDELKKLLAKAYEEKHQSDLTSKNSMRNVLQEKLEYVSKVTQLQRDYDKAEQECQKYKALYDSMKQEHTQDVTKLSEQLKQAELERKSLQKKLNEEKEVLASELEHLKSDVKYKEDQLLSTKQRLEETQDELVSLKITMETDKQRQVAGSNQPTTDSAVDQIRESFVEELPLGSLPPLQMNLVDSLGVSPLPEPRRPLVRRDTLLSPDNLVLQLESKQKEWELKVQGLEEELEESEMTVRNLQTQLAGYVKSEAAQKQHVIQEMAGQMAASAIAKGRLEILQTSLEAAEEKVHSLQEQLASEISLKTALQEQLEGLQAQLDGRTLQSKGNEVNSTTAAAVDRRSLTTTEESASLKGEADKFREKYAKQLSETVRVKTENTDLVREVEDLRRKLDEKEKLTAEAAGPAQKVGLSACPPPRPLHLLEDDDQRVKLLTIIALVSIGVALASWFT